MFLRLTKAQVNRAGDVLRGADPASVEYVQALGVMQEWRKLHSVPLHSIASSLGKVARAFEGNPEVARRLKRAPTIVNKLRAMPGMKLARMHDIAGARVILDDCIALRNLIKRLDGSRIRHERRPGDDDDYLTVPKRDGYRSYHQVYRFKGTGPTAEHDGLLVEVQLRTRIQHAWATAVETVGTFMRQQLKRNEGDADWLSFFRHVGSAFAYLEGERPDPELDLNRNQLFEYVREESQRIGVKRKLVAFAKTLEVTSRDSNRGVYLLHLRGGLDGGDALALDVRPFLSEDFAAAEAEYRRLEDAAGPSDDVVLVSAASTNGLRHAYPNYFLDTRAFIRLLDRVSDRSRRNARKVATADPQLTLPGFPEAISVPLDSMPSLGLTDAVRGLPVLARILWALELAKRASLGPQSAAAISELLRRHTAAPMHDTNVARFFRDLKDDQRVQNLWQVMPSKLGRRYIITDEGCRLVLALEAVGSEVLR